MKTQAGRCLFCLQQISHSKGRIMRIIDQSKLFTFALLSLVLLYLAACGSGDDKGVPNAGDEPIAEADAAVVEPEESVAESQDSELEIEDAGPEPDESIIVESKWNSTIDSVETPPYVERDLPGMPGQKTTFYLDDSGSRFLMVGLTPSTADSDSSLDLKDFVVRFDDSEDFVPVGLVSGFDTTIGTSGSCSLDILGDGEVEIDCDLRYDGANRFGIRNDDLKSQENEWGSKISVYEGPLLTLLYVLPGEYVNSGKLTLALPESQPIDLEVN
jgi:hypothetical protein